MRITALGANGAGGDSLSVCAETPNDRYHGSHSGTSTEAFFMVRSRPAALIKWDLPQTRSKRSLAPSSEPLREIEQVSHATDDQAATAEEVASLLDEAVEQADQVCKEIEIVASANKKQAARPNAINEAHLGG